MTLVLNTRPHFFTGQLIDYRDFNQLSARPDELMSAKLTHLYPGGGILAASATETEGFAVRILAKSKIEVGAGTAILDNGQTLNLREAKLFDLSPYMLDGCRKILVLAARNVLRGLEHFVDPEDNTIAGFKSEAFDPEFFFYQVSTTTPAPAGLEIFRVMIAPQSQEIRFLSPVEEWADDTEILNLVDQAPSVSLLDLRHRKVIAAFVARPYEFSQNLELRKSLLSMAAGVESLARTYLVPDTFHCEMYIHFLHAEILSQPFQPLKLSFLISKLAEKLSFYIEHLLQKTQSSRSDFNRDLALEAIQVLEPLRTAPVRAELLPIAQLTKFGDKLRQLIDYSETHYSLSATVRQALQELRTREFPFVDKISLAGRVFGRVDEVELSMEKRWSSKPEQNHRRKLSASFASGGELSLTGAFIREGSFFCRFDVKHADRPVLIMMKQYVRRAGMQISYEVNGRPMEAGRVEGADLENSWINKGLVIPSSLLVVGENQLSLHLEKTDLDFAFFGFSVYQPIVGEE